MQTQSQQGHYANSSNTHQPRLTLSINCSESEGKQPVVKAETHDLFLSVGSGSKEGDVEEAAYVLRW